MRIEAALVCSIGCIRTNNEDNFSFNGYFLPVNEMDKGAHLYARYRRGFNAFAVFDGMGGGDRGEYASSECAWMFRERMPTLRKASDLSSALTNYAKETSERIYNDARRTKSNMQGSTMAALLLRGNTAYIANVGDSRVYIERDGRLKLLTFDHSQAGMLQRQGLLQYEEVRNYPNSNVIQQYLGMDPQLAPSEFISHYSLPLCRGDRFMLCSDGLSDLIPWKQIELSFHAKLQPDTLACALTTAALELGGKDNITCIVIDVTDASFPSPNTNDPLFGQEREENTLDTATS